jgi:hypothetical protein
MTTLSDRLLLWLPRVLGLALAVFLGLFALDAFAPGTPAGRATFDFVIHLAPAALVLALVILSWHREWIGGLGFVALAVAYAVMVRFRLDWLLGISVPLFVVGTLFLWSWRHRAAAHLS